jgi:hypothetical protein
MAASDTFPVLPLPPQVDRLVGFEPTYSSRRIAYVGLIRRKAEEQGLPPAIADAVAHIESAFNPQAVGGVGEIGLMQIRPQTALMLGYRGPPSGLFEPDTNVHYSVTYLTGAWRRAGGDLCRTLMKYRAGHGEERMTPLSVEYCRRARSYLAAIGSPLGHGAVPSVIRPEGPFRAVALAATGPADTTTDREAGQPAPAFGASRPAGKQTSARQLSSLRKLRGPQFWAAHEARVKRIVAKLKRSRMQVAAGPQNRL